MNSFGKLHVEDLQPDHLEAVKLEQDGHLNRDYKKEIFLGNHEEVEEGNEEERQQKLKEIFYRYLCKFNCNLIYFSNLTLSNSINV